METGYAQGKISFEEIVKFLALSGMAYSIYPEVIKYKETRKKAGELGLTVSDEQLQTFADNYRKARDLYSARDTHAFLENSGLTAGDLESFCESMILIDLLKEHLADERKVEECFVNNRADFDLARISIIAVKEENLANEIIMQVTEDGEDFHALARKHSMDQKSKYSGGHIGLISRRLLGPEIAAKVFNASSGDVLGPFKINGLFQLILVEEVIRADLSNLKVKEKVKERIFNEWIGQLYPRN
ncbi:MAG: peptidylprolyl isomerase [bacterium]